jgi:hypothetical protein
MTRLTREDSLTIWQAQTAYRLRHLGRGLLLVPLLGLTLGGRWDLAVLGGVAVWGSLWLLGTVLRGAFSLLRRGQ